MQRGPAVAGIALSITAKIPGGSLLDHQQITTASWMTGGVQHGALLVEQAAEGSSSR
jgi:hypothetical protein